MGRCPAPHTAGRIEGAGALAVEQKQLPASPSRVTGTDGRRASLSSTDRRSSSSALATTLVDIRNSTVRAQSQWGFTRPFFFSNPTIKGLLSAHSLVQLVAQKSVPSSRTFCYSNLARYAISSSLTLPHPMSAKCAPLPELPQSHLVGPHSPTNPNLPVSPTTQATSCASMHLLSPPPSPPPPCSQVKGFGHFLAARWTFTGSRFHKLLFPVLVCIGTGTQG